MRKHSSGLPGFYLKYMERFFPQAWKSATSTVIQGMLIISQLALPTFGYASTTNTDISIQLTSDAIPESVVDLLSQADAAKQQHLQQQETYVNELNALQKSKSALVEQRRFYQKSAEMLRARIRWANFVAPANFSETEAFSTRFKRDNYFLKVAGHRRANNPLSPLLDKLETLHCAEKPEEAKSLLSQLIGISPEGMEWPDEWLGQQAGGAMLFAGSIDIALGTLHRTIERFPELKTLSERVALQWNYCPLLGEDGAFNNLSLKGEQLLRSKAGDAVPLNWNGFRSWGFLDQPGDDEGRYIPELLDISIPYYAYEIFLHRIHQLRCFPHPTTGKLYVDVQQDHLQNAKFYPRPPQKEAQKYPFNWYPYCELPKVKHRLQAAWPEHLFQRVGYKTQQLQQTLAETDASIGKLETLQKEQQALYQSDLNYLRQQISLQLDAEKIRVAEQKEQERQAVLREQELEHQQQLALQQEKEKKEQQALLAERQRLEAEASAEQQRLAVIAAEKKRLAAIAAEKKRLALLKVAEQNRWRALKAQEQRIAAAKVAEDKAEKARLAALTLKKRRAAEWEEKKRKVAAEALARKKRLAEARTDFASMVVPPKEFIPIPDGAAGDSGNSGALSAPFASTNTSNKANGKKKDEKLNLSATFLYDIPADGSRPSTKLSFGWKPVENWFARAAVKRIKGEAYTYSWGLGYSNWRPGTTSVQLNNWGPIKAGDGLSVEKAVLSVSHKIDSQILRDYKISTSLGISQPISGDLAVNGTFQWSPIPNWYFRTTASQKVKGEPTRWSYGFGYYDWRPETWRVEYSNYKNNRYPFDNFREGSVTISRSWEF